MKNQLDLFRGLSNDLCSVISQTYISKNKRDEVTAALLVALAQVIGQRANDPRLSSEWTQWSRNNSEVLQNENYPIRFLCLLGKVKY